jgi:predicted PurR-regulated permease PerM
VTSATRISHHVLALDDAVKSPTFADVEYVIRPTPQPIERPLQWLVLGLVALLAYVLRPVLAAVVVGGFVVLVAYPSFEWLARRLGGRRRLATWVATLAVLLALGVPMALVGYLTVHEASAGISWLAAQFKAIGGLRAIPDHLPPSLRPLFGDLVQRGSTELTRIGAEVAAETPEILGALGLLVGEAFLSVVTVFYLFREGPAFVSFLRRVSPLRPAHTEALLAEVREVAQGLFWGNLVTALFHGLAGALGYLIFGVPRVVFLGTLTLFASFVPVVGTALIWVPIAIVLLVSGHLLAGVGLLVWGVVVIGGIDNVLRPLVSRGRMKLPNLLVFLTLFGGVAIFGLKGLLLGPLFGSLAVTALRLVARERAQSTVAPSPSPDRDGQPSE